MISSRTYYKKSHPYAYATFIDTGPKAGLLHIYSDWGVFQSYWNATGCKHLEEFVLKFANDNYYLTSNLTDKFEYMGMKKSGYKLLDKFLLHCWPELKEIIRTEFDQWIKQGENNEKMES